MEGNTDSDCRQCLDCDGRVTTAVGMERSDSSGQGHWAGTCLSCGSTFGLDQSGVLFRTAAMPEEGVLEG
jgi:hypothetical protein